MHKLIASTALAAIAFAGAASAQTAASAATDLNLRAGPQATAEILGVIASGDEVQVAGCLDGSNWCQVTYNDQQGWAYGDYLTTTVGDAPQPLYENRQTVGVAVIAPPATTEAQDTAVGAGSGAAAGALAGGPVGALIGAAIGTVAANAASNPSPEVRTYITSNPQEPVILDGEVVIGAGIPDTVTLYEIPGSPEYRYVTVNSLPVLVDADRRIVHIYR